MNNVLSPTAIKVMRYVRRHALHSCASVQIAAYGRAPWLSACRSLVRRGLMRAGSDTGHYALTEAGGIALALAEQQEQPK
jgi:hypothetical protein